MQKKTLSIVLIMCIELMAGCSNGSGETTRIVHSIPPTFSCKPGDKDGLLKGVCFSGKTNTENVEVFYQEHLKTQADCIANQINKSLSHIEASTGFQMAFNKIKVYLRRVDRIPQKNVRQMFIESDNNLNVILFVEADNDSCESIIHQNCIYPSVLIHEIVEVSLLYPAKGPSVLNDYELERFVFWKDKILNYTRWFREGFSSYAGYLAYKLITSDINFDRSTINLASLQNCLHLHPFSALSKVGKDLFIWHQFSHFHPDSRLSPNLPISEKTITDYYDAAFGLFLVIRDRFGENAIRKIVNEIKTIEIVDGSALIKLSNRILNTDIKKLVENFHFPKTGLYMEALFPGEGTFKGLSVQDGLFVMVVEPNSIGELAGIKKGDVIYKINEKNVTTNLDFEIALYELMGQQNIKLSVWREGFGEMDAELKLTN